MVNILRIHSIPPYISSGPVIKVCSASIRICNACSSIIERYVVTIASTGFVLLMSELLQSMFPFHILLCNASCIHLLFHACTLVSYN